MNRIAARILGTRLATLRAEGDAIGVVDPDGRGLLAAVEADHAALEEALAAPGVALALSAQPTARLTCRARADGALDLPRPARRRA
jgi:hypothetical protein